MGRKILLGLLGLVIIGGGSLFSSQRSENAKVQRLRHAIDTAMGKTDQPASVTLKLEDIPSNLPGCMAAAAPLIRAGREISGRDTNSCESYLAYSLSPQHFWQECLDPMIAFFNGQTVESLSYCKPVFYQVDTFYYRWKKGKFRD